MLVRKAKCNEYNSFNENKLSAFTLVERVPSKDWEVVV